ncbi:9 TM domain-containing transmembrane protein [Acrasis kona]|uniref:9 TM domain-containing transmembrane protein n=1 Tax=Acrasis kona TaxID=1008807 RepID=A0AAW2ZEA5_9EUKA
MDSVKGCVFTQGKATLTAVAVDITSTTVYCNLPLLFLTQNSITELDVVVYNIYGDTSNSNQKMYFHDSLILSQLNPSVSPTIGNISTLITVLNFLPNFNIYVRFGQFISKNPCNVVNSTVVKCDVISHSSGNVRVMLSHDKVNWYMQYGDLFIDQDTSITRWNNFYYQPCAAGWESPRYDIPCKKCQPGYFKPIEGTFNCIQCSNGTYSSNEASLTCDKCPIYTTSADRSPSYYSCVCPPGYFYLGENKNAPCVSCLTGANCQGYNITIPNALKGFWHTAADPYNYVACYPAAACPGGAGGFDYCAPGYNNLSRVCGQCQNGFYKWQNACRECTPGAWYKLLLAGIGLAVITVVFFAVSSTKVTHLSSISIAFGFWQILSIFSSFDVQWPTTVGDSLVAASLANFNIDFLSPQCVFPEMTFATKWVLITCVPFYFLFAFIVLYIFGLIRGVIVNRTGKYIPFKYKRFKLDENITLINYSHKMMEQSVRKRDKIKYKLLNIVGGLYLMCFNVVIYSYNFSLWMIKGGVTRRQSRVFLSKIINSFTALISFLYLFIIQQASQIFVCTPQADSSLTLNASPDIQCSLKDDQWVKMLPLSIIIYIIFGLGYVIMFIVLYFRSKYLFKKQNELKMQMASAEELNDEQCVLVLESQLGDVKTSIKNFKTEFKFLLTRFKIKYFFWELVITSRKLAVAILNTFLPSILVVVFGLLIMFLSLILHMQTVPFRKKFHNLTEYVVLISIVLTLFFGLLFFVDQFPTPQFKSFCNVITIIVIIASTVIVILMSMMDFLIRRRKENAAEKAKRDAIREKFGDLKEQELEAEYKKLFPSVFHNVETQGDDDVDDWLVEKNPLFESNDDLEDEEWALIINPLSEVVEVAVSDYMDTEASREIRFTPPFYMSDADSEGEDEENKQTLNGIILDVFSMRRLKKNLGVMKSGGKNIAKKFRKKNGGFHQL